jgi:hypothetical protein
MIRLLTMLIAILLGSLSSAQKSDWIDLFDGETLDGWTANFPDQSYEVKDGVIELMAVKKNLWMVHDAVFRNFELVAEIKAPLENYNTGIGFRCDEKPVGYQCEIFDEQSGSLYAIKKGWIHPPSKDDFDGFYANAGDCYKKGEWNSYRIVCVGDRIQIWVNGHETTDIRDTTFKEGRVAIQHHGRGDTHYFRNIRIRTIAK